jgi:polysaccharide export outer membrane protein
VTTRLNFLGATSRFSRGRTAVLAAAFFAQISQVAVADQRVDKAPSSSVAAALAVQTAAVGDYRIGPLDKLNIVVFGVKELTVDNMQVDASGQILLPLIGAVTAKGKTTSELSKEIAGKLQQSYMQSPQVSVTVADTASQKVTVEGAVNEAGVFELKGRTSLLEAVARAKGLSKAANAHRVAIIRTVEGVPRAASFDFAAISAGRAANPEVLANDVVIVDTSKSKAFWHGMVEVLPALYILTFL